MYVFLRLLLEVYMFVKEDIIIADRVIACGFQVGRCCAVHTTTRLLRVVWFGNFGEVDARKKRRDICGKQWSGGDGRIAEGSN
jgi:hypothetical protein